MPLFHKKSGQKIPFDPSAQELAVRRSICTGEMTVGFVERNTGKFHEYALARDQKELEDFCRSVGVASDAIRTIY